MPPSTCDFKKKGKAEVDQGVQEVQGDQGVQDNAPEADNKLDQDKVLDSLSQSHVLDSLSSTNSLASEDSLVQPVMESANSTIQINSAIRFMLSLPPPV